VRNAPPKCAALLVCRRGLVRVIDDEDIDRDVFDFLQLQTELLLEGCEDVGTDVGWIGRRGVGRGFGGGSLRSSDELNIDLNQSVSRHLETLAI